MTKLKSKIKALNVVISIENVLCVYRNFSTFSKRAQILATIKVFLVSLIYIATFTHYMIYLYIRFYKRDFMLYVYKVLHHLFTNSITLTSFATAIHQSLHFKILIAKIDLVHKCCKNETMFPGEQRKVILRNIIHVILLTSTALINCGTILFYALDVINTFGVCPFIIIVLNLALALCRACQFFVQFAHFNILVNIIILALKEINLTFSNFTKDTYDKSHDDGYIKIDCLLLHRKIRKFIPIFNCLMVCSNKMKVCFGIQVLFSLFMLSFFYVFLGYRGILTIIEKKVFEDFCITIVHLCNYMSIIVSLLYAGQMAETASNDLRRSLAKLYNNLLTIPGPEAYRLRKPVKDFLRQMTTEPIKIRILSGLPVKMVLLLQILSTVVSYTIVLLQFNQVV